MQHLCGTPNESLQLLFPSFRGNHELTQSRPHSSDIGLNTSGPNANASKKMLRTSDMTVGFVTWKSKAMGGSAGAIMVDANGLTRDHESRRHNEVRFQQ